MRQTGETGGGIGAQTMSRENCRSDLVDISAEVKGETDKAWKLFDGATAEWVPKSQVEDNRDGTYAMPQWLAKDKGFI